MKTRILTTTTLFFLFISVYAQENDMALQTPGSQKDMISQPSETEVEAPNADDYFNEGLACLQNNKFKSAIQAFNKVIHMEKNFADAWFYRGVAFSSIGNDEEAVYNITRALDYNPEAESYYMKRAEIYYKMDVLDEAFVDYCLCLELNDEHAEAYYKRAFVQLKLEEYDAACKDWKQADKLGHPKAAGMLANYCD
jgi:tetratricopeptide (TPR) repeat protein